MSSKISWPLRSALYRTGIPAATMFTIWAIYDIIRRGPDESIGDILVGLGGVFVLVWLAASVFWWLMTKVIPRRKANH